MAEEAPLASVRRRRIEQAATTNAGTELDFGSLDMTNRDVEALTEALGGGSWKKLDLRDNLLDDGCATTLGRILEATDLKELVLDGNRLTNSGVLTVMRSLRRTTVSFRRNPEVTYPELEELPDDFKAMAGQVQFSIGISAPWCRKNGVFAFVRFRPDSGPVNVNVEFQQDHYAMTLDGSSPTSFDRVLTDDVTPTDLVEGVAEKAIFGFSTAIMAYGGTGSGKTFTIDQLRHDVAVSLAEASHREKAKSQLDDDRSFDATCRFSFIEVYNERLYDLTTNEEFKLRIARDPVTNDEILETKGLSTKDITLCADDAVVSAALDVIRSGEANRRVRATAMNERSSRAHCIFKIQVIVERRSKKSAVVTSQRSSANIFLVDLAGNEKLSVHRRRESSRSNWLQQQKDAASLATRELETKNINKSLLTLQQVVAFTAERSTFANPDDAARYQSAIRSKCRDSQLTLLLNQAFGGENISVLFACCRRDFSGPTMQTLDFASVFRCLDNKPKRQNTQDINWHALSGLLMQHLHYLFRKRTRKSGGGGPKRVDRPVLTGFEDAFLKLKHGALLDLNADVPSDEALLFRDVEENPPPEPEPEPEPEKKTPTIRAAHGGAAHRVVRVVKVAESADAATGMTTDFTDAGTQADVSEPPSSPRKTKLPPLELDDESRLRISETAAAILGPPLSPLRSLLRDSLVSVNAKAAELGLDGTDLEHHFTKLHSDQYNLIKPVLSNKDQALEAIQAENAYLAARIQLTANEAEVKSLQARRCEIDDLTTKLSATHDVLRDTESRLADMALQVDKHRAAAAVAAAQLAQQSSQQQQEEKRVVVKEEEEEEESPILRPKVPDNVEIRDGECTVGVRAIAPLERPPSSNGGQPTTTRLLVEVGTTRSRRSRPSCVVQ